MPWKIMTHIDNGDKMQKEFLKDLAYILFHVFFVILATVVILAIIFWKINIAILIGAVLIVVWALVERKLSKWIRGK